MKERDWNKERKRQKGEREGGSEKEKGIERGGVSVSQRRKTSLSQSFVCLYTYVRTNDTMIACHRDCFKHSHSERNEIQRDTARQEARLNSLLLLFHFFFLLWLSFFLPREKETIPNAHTGH